jgi:hypothetical protein
MIHSRKLVALAAGVSATLFFSAAAANNGIQKYEWKKSIPELYVACLNDIVAIDINIVGSYHEFDTASGKHHLVDQWQYTWEFRSLSSDRTWFAHGATPFSQNIGPGQTLQFGENFVARPITGDGPKFKLHYRVKVTQNANGELVVLMDDVDFLNGGNHLDFIQCIGKR